MRLTSLRQIVCSSGGRAQHCPPLPLKGALLRYDFALRSESIGWLMHSQLRARVVSQNEMLRANHFPKV
ncbi:MAG: hypothetical protein HY069_02155 [Chlamydiia bacterium]|nr:hypothetical protein [Chlamydiia bacterium]